MQWFGWFAVGVGVVIVTYYAIIMSWSVNYTWEAATLGWQDNMGQYANVEYALETTDLEDMAVLTPVPERLWGTEFTDPVKIACTAFNPPAHFWLPGKEAFTQCLPWLMPTHSCHLQATSSSTTSSVLPVSRGIWEHSDGRCSSGS